MAKHREQVDKRMMQQINRRVITPLLIDLGARYLGQALHGQVRRRRKDRQLGLRPQESTATSVTALPSPTWASTTSTAT